MNKIKVDCTFEERTSKEGKTYKALFIKIADNYEKMIFLNVPEVALLENYYKDETESIDFNSFK